MNGDGKLIFSTNPAATNVFGSSAQLYASLVNQISPSLFNESYLFVENKRFEAMLKGDNDSRGQAHRIYWIELLSRAHMTSVASIYRSCRWIDVAVREYEADNLYGWAAACRSFIESAGDTAHTVQPALSSIAENHREIKHQLSGNAKVAVVSRELEDILIHFTHARKVAKGEQNIPTSHSAEQSWKYVNKLEKLKVVGISTLYSTLCEIVHPAADSVRSLFLQFGETVQTEPKGEQVWLGKYVSDSRSLLGGTMEIALNPPILMLKLLHQFKLFSNLPTLRRSGLEHTGAWVKIEELLASPRGASS